jgi:hypothetical protein
MPASSTTAVRDHSCHRTEQLSASRSLLLEERSFLLDQGVVLDAELKSLPDSGR